MRTSKLARRVGAVARMTRLVPVLLLVAGCNDGGGAPRPLQTPSTSLASSASTTIAATPPPSPPPTVAASATSTPRAASPGPSPIVDATGFSRTGWKTDFSKHTVPLSEIQSGGPPRDGIPPIDRPSFVEPSAAAAWLADNEPVVVYEENGDARAYPLQILIWHEIVNDTVGGRPVAITFCPLCNTAIAFDRRLAGVTYDFGTTGNLRRSDLVMWDRQTESWWQQITGEAIVGELAGAHLTPVPAAIQSFAAFRTAFPTGQVLSRETGFRRDYGRNPYVGYDDVASSPFLYSGPSDGRLPPMARVVTVALNGDAVAYPFSHLEQRGVTQDVVGGTPIVILFQKGTASALDAGRIAGSRDVGAAGVFEPLVAGRALTFRAEGGRLLDDETASEWDALGRATAGPLAGQRLRPVVHANHFWFAMAAFYPNVRIWQPG
ncbi:MAG TPA: DUF3179 domain-containing protein [Chloroflexota bacterium]|nr:DUF3179 domain-containing protein [Chloroflexota bacterium]